ncbi:hypothetical protein ACLFKQ_12990 [Myxosarcina sp. GI1(2024)]
MEGINEDRGKVGLTSSSSLSSTSTLTDRYTLFLLLPEERAQKRDGIRPRL